MNLKQFKIILDKACDYSITKKKSVVLRYTKPISLSINFILNNFPINKDMFYMNFPKQNNSYFGIGKSISYKISSKKELMKLKEKNYIDICNIKNDHLMFFGGASFDFKKESFYPWNNIPKGEFVLPRILITKNKCQTNMTYIEIINQKKSKKTILNDYKKSCKMIDELKENNTENKKNCITIKKQIPEYNNYIKKIEKIIKRLNNKNLGKVVISRLIKYSITHNISINKLIEYLNNQYPECFNFFICFNSKNIFFGSTPEKLITLNNKSYTIDGIAGSSNNKNYLNNCKEISEHNYVIKYIDNKMRKISNKINIPKTPSILDLNYIYHLYTPISGELNNNTHILDLVSNLYPTPALLGYKKEEAIKKIRLFEKSDRGWYGGCIGTYNIKGDGKFYVPIRSGLISKNNLFLFSGSGIVSDSIPKKEWDETELKLKHILSYFKK